MHTLNSAVIEVNAQLHAPRDLLSGKSVSGICWVRGWVSFELGVDDPDRKKNLLLLSGTNPDSSCTDVIE
jgi:hypothetical protein